MKKIHIRISITLLILVLGILACKNLLEEDPKDQVFVDNFFQTANDATAAVCRAYALQWFFILSLLVAPK